MAGLNAGTTVLLLFWTAWTTVALLQADWPHGILLGVIYLPAGLVVAATGGVTWRSYVMAWLVIQVVAAGVLYTGDRRRMWLALASFCGLISLWVQSGTFYWQAVAGFPFVLCVCGTAAGAAYAGWQVVGTIRLRRAGVNRARAARS